MRNTGRVVSMEYSKKCKIFIFPKDEMRAEWLDIINYMSVKSPEIQSFELLSFLVCKLNNEQYELGIEPEKLVVDRKCEIKHFTKSDFTSFSEMNFLEGFQGGSTTLSKKTPEPDTLFNWDDGMSLLDNTSRRSTLSKLIDDPNFLEEIDDNNTYYSGGKDDRRSKTSLNNKTLFESFGKRDDSFVPSHFDDYNLGFDSGIDNYNNIDSLQKFGESKGVRRVEKNTKVRHSQRERTAFFDKTNFDDSVISKPPY